MNSDNTNEELVIAEFLTLISNDIDKDQLEAIEHYQSLFPGYEALITSEYESLGPGRGQLQKIGRFEITGLLGEGSQARVLSARDPLLGRDVAVKILRSFSDSDARLRFRREAELLSELDDSGICTVHEFDEHDGQLFIVIGLAEGRTLDQCIKSWTADQESNFVARGSYVAMILDLFLQLSRSLASAHEKNVVHRDLKPANVIVDSRGKPTILDFGLACLLSDRSSLTADGDLLGTPNYMSPEQITRQNIRPDLRTDVWAMGVMLYEALSMGRRPFVGVTREKLYNSIMTDRHASLDKAALWPHENLALVIDTCLNKNRDHRYDNAQELADELGRVMAHEEIVARALSWRTRFREWWRREKRVAASFLALLLLTILSIGLSFRSYFDAQERIRAENELGLQIQRRAEEKTELLDLSLGHHLPHWADQLWPPRPENIVGNRGMLAWRKEAQSYLGRWRKRTSILPAEASNVELLVEQMDKRIEATRAAENLCLVEGIGQWTSAINEIAEMAIYDGLQLKPIFGLLPLGVNQSSGLYEFWHVLSGDKPATQYEDSNSKVDAAVGIMLVLLPGGWLSTAPDPAVDPNSRIRIPAFFISKFEVTQAQWNRWSDTNPSSSAPGTHTKFLIELNHPVENMSWQDATTWATRLSLQLPTELEWLYAAGGFMKTNDGLVDREQIGNVADQALKNSGAVGASGGGYAEWDDRFPLHAPVGRFTPNHFGLFDMHGNVAEWCSGQFETDPATMVREFKVRSLESKSNSANRPFRGGNWYVGPKLSLPERRWRRSQDARAANLGLRPIFRLGSEHIRLK